MFMKNKKNSYIFANIAFSIIFLISTTTSSYAANTSNSVPGTAQGSTVQGTLSSTGNSGTISSNCKHAKNALCKNFKYSCDANGVATLDSAVNGYGKACHCCAC